MAFSWQTRAAAAFADEFERLSARFSGRQVTSVITATIEEPRVGLIPITMLSREAVDKARGIVRVAEARRRSPSPPRSP